MEKPISKISVVIPVKNESRTIIQLLKSFEAQSLYPSEIIIVDGGSQDDTPSIVRSYIQTAALPYSVRVIEAGQAYPGKGRNIGIREAKNDIIACTDAGVILASSWLAGLAKPFEEKDVEVVIGDFQPLADTFFELCSFYIATKGLKNKGIIFSGGTSLAFKKAVWQKIGGFEDDLYPCEDKFFLSKVYNLKFNVRKAGDAVAYWRPRPDIIQFSTQCFYYGLSDGRIGFAQKNHVFRLLFYIGVLFFGIIGLKLKIILLMPILLLLFRLIYDTILAYRLIQNPLALLYAPWMVLVKDLSQVAGFIMGNYSRINEPYFKDLYRKLKQIERGA